MTDRFERAPVGLQDPLEDGVPATPAGGDVVLAATSRMIYVGGIGDLKVQMLSGNDVTFVGVPAGSQLPIRVKKIYNAGTTAAAIVACN